MIDDIFVYIDRTVSLDVSQDIPMPMRFLCILLVAKYHVQNKKSGGEYKIFTVYEDVVITHLNDLILGDSQSTQLFKIEPNGSIWYKDRYTAASIYLDNFHFVEEILVEKYHKDLALESLGIQDVETFDAPENGNVHSVIGERQYMEDTHIYERRGIVKYYMVADGHGGTRTSRYLQANLADSLFFNLQKNITTTLINTFVEMDKKLFDVQIGDGSTCIVGLIVHNQFYFANLGDSRGLLIDVTDRKIVVATRDHKPTDLEEYKRVCKAGGMVFQKRVQGRLAVSRAFGDAEFKTRNGKYMGKDACVSPVPDVYRYTLNADHKYTMIMACDGLWDVCANEEVRDYILDEKTSEDIVKIALQKKTTDNVTVMIDHL